MPRDQHASLTCRAEGTVCLSLGRYDGVFACASPAGYRITPHNLTSPLYSPLSTCILVEYPPPKYTQGLAWVSGHHMTSIAYLRRRWHTLTLHKTSICLRSTDMLQCTDMRRFV
jgi:hypothetical protein